MAEIRLKKVDKTVRLSNPDGVIRLSRDNKTIKVVNRRETLRLRHTGKTGPQGPQGDTGVSTFVRAHHRDDSSYARPDALYVEWVGTVAPSNATTEDTWVRTY